jgi:hypothetical protein
MREEELQSSFSLPEEELQSSSDVPCHFLLATLSTGETICKSFSEFPGMLEEELQSAF